MSDNGYLILPDDPRTYTEEDLKKYKLAAEIRKMTAEAVTAEAVLRETLFAERKENAMPWKRREYNFLSDVSTAEAASARLTLDMWVELDRGPDEGRPYRVVFHSPGGNVFAGLGMYDAMRNVSATGHPILTVTNGAAMSMGAVLMQGGDERIVGPNATMMIHEVSLHLGRDQSHSSTELGDMHKLTEKLQGRLLDILAERSTLSVDEIAHRWQRRDWYLDAEEAVEYGFADRIA